MALQAFKENDPKEAKFTAACLNLLNVLSTDRDSFFEGAYTAYPLGDVLYDSGHPLAGILTKETFRTCFPAIHELFIRPGPFEYYLTVFRAIWGDTVLVDVDVPAPGQLTFDIEALQTQLDVFSARSITDDTYFYDDVLTSDTSEDILFQTVSGIKTQREVDALMREITPAGIYAQATLSLS